MELRETTSKLSAQRGRWLELSVEAMAEAVDAVVDLFSRYSYQGGVAVSHAVAPAPDQEGGTIDETKPARVAAYLPLDEFADQRIEAIRQGLWHLEQIQPIGELHIRVIAEEDWAESWKQFFPVLHIGKHIVIRPSWQDYTPQSGEIVIDLDPGMAFGTGLHPTTRHCLELLEDLPLQGATLLDAGAGSGILSIAAIKLGAQAVDAVELDPVAIDVLKANLLRNNVASAVTVHQGDILSLPLPQRYSCIVANIFARVLIEAAPRFRRALMPSGLMILSGIITEARDDVVQRYRHLGFTVRDQRQEGDWVTLLLQRNDDL